MYDYNNNNNNNVNHNTKDNHANHSIMIAAKVIIIVYD